MTFAETKAPTRPRMIETIQEARTPHYDLAMRLSILAAVAAACVCAAPTAAGAAYKPCPGGFDPDGSKGDFYAQIRAKGVSCSTAKSVTRAWIKHQNMTDGANPTGRVKIKGMRCTGKAIKKAGDPNGGLAVTCVKGTTAVRFYGHP